jgi:type II secretory pathway pseudopilin PulG
MGSVPTFRAQARAVFRLLLPVAGVLLLLTLIAACSSPGQTNGQNRVQQSQAKALAYSRCMRAHGVSNYPDPTFSGNGVSTHLPQGVANSPNYNTAQQACKKYQGPGTLSPQQVAQAKQDGNKMAQCMHAHGFPTFPEPNSQGVIVIQPSDGIDTNSTLYQNATNTCEKGNIIIEQNSGGGQK